MEIVDTAKFIIGLVFLPIAAIVLWRARATRGFNQSRQAGALFLIAAAVFVGVGLGQIDL